MRPMMILPAATLAMLAFSSGCSRPASSGFLEPGKLAAVVVGRSSRENVFTALGTPVRTERSGAGESWVYEITNETGPPSGLVSRATTASALAGAFVPYVGLLGSGIGLANTARTSPDAMSLVIKFGTDGIVLDCVQASTAAPSGMPGVTPAARVDCTRLPRASG